LLSSRLFVVEHEIELIQRQRNEIVEATLPIKPRGRFNCHNFVCVLSDLLMLTHPSLQTFVFVLATNEKDFQREKVQKFDQTDDGPAEAQAKDPAKSRQHRIPRHENVLAVLDAGKVLEVNVNGGRVGCKVGAAKKLLMVLRDVAIVTHFPLSQALLSVLIEFT